MKFQVLRNELLALAPLSGAERLDGIHIDADPQRTLLVATNGRALAVIKSQAGQLCDAEARFTIPSTYFPLIECLTEDALDIIYKPSGAFSIGNPSSGFWGTPMGLYYPNWRLVVMQEYNNAPAAMLDSLQLGRFRVAADLFAAELYLRPSAGMEPTRVWLCRGCKNVAWFYGLIMPLNEIVQAPTTVPGWLLEDK